MPIVRTYLRLLLLAGLALATLPLVYADAAGTDRDAAAKQQDAADRPNRIYVGAGAFNVHHGIAFGNPSAQTVRAYLVPRPLTSAQIRGARDDQMLLAMRAGVATNDPSNWIPFVELESRVTEGRIREVTATAYDMVRPGHVVSFRLTENDLRGEGGDGRLRLFGQGTRVLENNILAAWEFDVSIPIEAEVDTRARVIDGPRTVDRRHSDVLMEAVGPNTYETTGAMFDLAARTALGDTVRNSAFADEQWASAVREHCEIRPGTQSITFSTFGTIEHRADVRVDRAALLVWARDRGHAVDRGPQVPDVPGESQIPDPTIVMLPSDIAGDYTPRDLTNNERQVQTILQGAAIDDPFNLQILSYNDVVAGARAALEGRSGTADLIDYAIAADIYIKYDVRIEAQRGGLIQAIIDMQGIIVTTGSVAISATATSRILPANREQQAVASAAEDAVGDFLRGLFRQFNQEYEAGIPYAVRFTNVNSLDDALAVRQALIALTTDGRVNDFEFEATSGILSCLVRADPRRYGDPFVFAIALRAALQQADYSLDRPLLNRRFIFARLVDAG